MKQERSWIEIDLAKFRSNLRKLTKLIPQNIDFLQIVKADAYGHGALQIAEEAINLGAKLLGVANSDEGILLRSKNVTIPILILSPSLEHEIPQIVNNNLTPSISSDNFLNKFSDYLKEQNIESYPVHINIDTGMKRSGVAIDDFPKFYSKITNLTNIVIEGIYSHFAGSESDTKLTLSQRYKFKLLLESLESLPRYIHLDNSYGLLSDDFSFSNLVRIGILSFGIKTNEILEMVDKAGFMDKIQAVLGSELMLDHRTQLIGCERFVAILTKPLDDNQTQVLTDALAQLDAVVKKPLSLCIETKAGEE